MAMVIDVRGETRELDGYKPNAEHSLPMLQRAVGGYIELVRLHDGSAMFVNEEGRLIGLPANPVASMLARKLIVGDVVLLTPEETEMEFSE